MKARLYYECHITIEPVFDTDRVMLEAAAKAHGFRLAELLMKKRAEDSPERSKYDTFMTTHGSDYDDVFSRMRRCVEAVEFCGFKVWRAKIEDTLFDTKHGDVLDG